MIKLKRHGLVGRLLTSVLLGMVLIVASCAIKTIQQNLYASLDTAVVLYNTTYDLAQYLDTQGEISAEDKPAIQKAFNGAEGALKTASNVLEVYIRKPTMENRELFERSLLIFNELIINLKLYLKE